MTSTFDSIDKSICLFHLEIITNWSIDILKSVKLSEKSSTSSKSNTHSESKESIWALTQAYILSALQFLRSIVFKLTGIKPNTPPATNYILMLFLFAKDTVIAPIATKLSSLEQSQQFVVIGLSAFFLWLPALILTFWLLPTLVCLTTVFYLLMFGFEPFMTHMDETLTELTGWTTSVIIFELLFTSLSRFAF